MSTLVPEARVRVAMREKDAASPQLFAAMNGRTAVVKETRGSVAGTFYIVEFDAPIPHWLPNAKPIVKYHFDASELEVLP